MKTILSAALVAVLALAPTNTIADDISATAHNIAEAAEPIDFVAMAKFFQDFGVALRKPIPDATRAAIENQENQIALNASAPIPSRPAFVELGVYIQSGQIRSASILADGGPFYVNDDTPPVSATIWVTPKDLSIKSVEVADIPVKRGIELSLANVPTEAMIIVLVGGCPDLSVFGGKPMYSRLIHTYTSADGKTDTVAVVDCPQ